METTSGSSTGLIVGVTIGVLVPLIIGAVVIAIVLAIVFIISKRRNADRGIKLEPMSTTDGEEILVKE